MTYDDSKNSQPSILVVEDDLSIGEIISTVIKQEMSYDAHTVASGKQALSFLEQSRPNLIILDYYLPDMTGIELYDQLQAMSGIQNIPVLLMSASLHDEETDPRHIVVLDKPFELDDLVAKINLLLMHENHLSI
jgi:CheY-like chemotaxis protein